MRGRHVVFLWTAGCLALAPSRPTHSVFVRNIATDADEQSIGAVLSEFGEVTSVWLAPRANAARHRGFGKVTFAEASAAALALRAPQPLILRGRELRIEADGRRRARSFRLHPHAST